MGGCDAPCMCTRLVHVSSRERALYAGLNTVSVRSLSHSLQPAVDLIPRRGHTSIPEPHTFCSLIMADKYSSETSEEDSARGDGVIRKKRKRERKYRREWEKKFPWLKPSVKNPYKAVCHKCNVELTAEITPIKLHEKSAKHIQNCAAPSTSRTIAEAFASAKGQTSKSDAVKAAEIKVTAWMMEHYISFRAADHLCDVLKDCFPDSEITRNLKMKRTKCQSVCKNILAKCHKEELGEKLRHNKFSILVDESTDISTSQNVCIVVRLAEEAAVVSKFWDLVPIFSNDDPE